MATCSLPASSPSSPTRVDAESGSAVPLVRLPRPVCVSAPRAGEGSAGPSLPAERTGLTRGEKEEGSLFLDARLRFFSRDPGEGSVAPSIILKYCYETHLITIERNES